MFVFRNNTIERFFPADYQFSGYADISVIPEADGYVWFYQEPLHPETEVAAQEVESYIPNMQFVLGQISSTKTMIALTMVPVYSVNCNDSDRRLVQAVENYNDALYALAAEHKNLRVLDLNEFTSAYAATDLFDWKYYFISQMGLNPRLARDFQTWWNRKLNSIALIRKKCLVLDLDNTLWGGILGEDGMEGIQIGGDYPGKAFGYWQKALLELSKQGIILCINSKNNEKDVMEAWEKHPSMVLRKEHFAAWKINWTDKASNMRALAAELNIGLDSMVFVDDNPTERTLIRQELPMVAVPEFPSQPYELMTFYKQIVETYFQVYAVTEEDIKKTAQYKANALRASAQTQYTNMDEYLRSLEMVLTIREADEYSIPRIAQMTQKTNQFNLTTRRYTEADIRQILADGGRIWTLSIQDKFGDNGITGLLILKGDEIDTFLMSCRVLGKGIEEAFVKIVLKQLQAEQTRVTASYIPTEKNGQVKDFWAKMGFVVAGGEGKYALNLQAANLDIKDYYTIQ